MCLVDRYELKLCYCYELELNDSDIKFLSLVLGLVATFVVSWRGPGVSVQRLPRVLCAPLCMGNVVNLNRNIELAFVKTSSLSLFLFFFWCVCESVCVAQMLFLVGSQLLLFHDEVRESHYLVSSWMTVVCMGLNGFLLVQNMASRTTKHWAKKI